tara:strand:+ start:2701 stop:2940 length:240 start_codon:yes stop_codon:yes gene_type:complete
MHHTVEDLIRRINVMHEKAILLHRIRNQYSKASGKNYDISACKNLINDIQALALSIAYDKGEPDEIKTEMEYDDQKTLL